MASKAVIRIALVAFVMLVFACTVATASTSESPARTIKRLQAENTRLLVANARLRFQNRNLLIAIDTLFKRIDQLNSDITDCVMKLPPPVGP